MASRKHVVITGTGRAGTSFLVELLTHLGLNTGFTVDDLARRKHKFARAGLEHDIRKDDSPFIVKSPSFCDYADSILSRDDIVIERIFVPMHDLFQAAESRRHVVNETIANLPLHKRLQQKFKPRPLFGGLRDTHSSAAGKQEEILMTKIYELLLAASNTFVPVTLMQYPRITKDDRYLYQKLEPILQGMPYDTFHTGFAKAVKPDLVHNFTPTEVAAPANKIAAL